MSSDRWGKLQEIFIAALQREPGDRLLFAREACRGDAPLQAEVESLLRSYDEESGFLKESPLGTHAADRILRNLDPSAEPKFGETKPLPNFWKTARDFPETESTAPDSAGAATGTARALARHPAAIGRYRIVRLLGEGGMGSVYEAEQEQPRRIVALKLIKPGLVGPELLWRFRQESQALARLQHPGIAQIYEAGAEDSGSGLQPFFAMEFIRGRPLLQYADENHLNTRRRLELMAKVCDAVRHAHDRGLIHRDLKPGNILVDETGQPKILDFGVARVTDSDVEATHQTDVGQLVGTLAYMSPEQVLADPLALDTRSDVYAVGVILYQLLAGRLPYHISPKVHEAARAIQYDDPAPLSSINRGYRGDVETIVAKALEKDKARRYASAADLAADIRRHLQDEPIIARPPGAIYQVGKFARRHKALVTGVFAVFVALAGGVIASTEQAMRARRAEGVALNEAATAKAVSDFLENDLLAQASANNQSGPAAKPNPDLKVRTALDRAATRIGGKFDRQPEVEASIRDTIGQTYVDLGLYPDARKHLERALELHRRALGAENPKTLKTISRLGNTFRLEGKYPEAEALLERALPVARRVLGPEHPDTLTSMNNLATVYYRQGKFPQAEAVQSQTLEIQRRVLGAEQPGTLQSMNDLANDYLAQGRYAQAESLHSQTLEIRRRLLGLEHPNTLKSMSNLALTYLSQGKYEQAESLLGETLESRRRVLGHEHPDTAASMSNLADIYRLQGKYAQAQLFYGQALEIRSRVLGPEHPDTLSSINNVALTYFDQGKYSRAEALHGQTLEIRSRVLGPEHPFTLVSMNNLADAYFAQHKYAQAEALFNRSVETGRRVLGPEHPYILAFLSDMAAMYQRQGKYDKAETAAAQSLAGQRHVAGLENLDTMVATADLALAYQSQGKFAESEPLAREAFEFERNKRPDDWQGFRAESLLGASLAGQRKYTEAEPLLLAGYQGMAARKERIAVMDLYHLNRAGKWLVQLYVDWGKPEKAAAWRTARPAR